MHRTIALTFALATLPAPLSADEGMWLFNAFPADRVEKAYGFKPDQSFLEHVRLASARFNSGGSGLFVSSRGLLVTNQHVGRDCIAKLSTADRDREKEGFSTTRLEEEVRCPDLEVNVLLEIEDVTTRVKAAEKSGSSDAERNRARKAAMIQLEQACATSPDRRCDVVTLYGGGAYHLYKYKRYSDIRLVFAPEQAVSFFGGDIDNFEYPRFNLDISFFRAYENDRPAETPHYFRFSDAPLQEGELVFVSGHPGRTERHLTAAQTDFLRDVAFPYQLSMLLELEKRLNAYAGRSVEASRQSQALRYHVANSRKRTRGLIEGVNSDVRMGPKRAAEKELREALAKQPNGAEWLAAFDAIAAAQARYRELYHRYQVLEAQGRSLNGKLATLARHLVRLPRESRLPNEKRLPEYSDSAQVSLKQQLFSTAPIYKEMEVVVLQYWLERLSAQLGASDPMVQQLLQGRTPSAAATAMIAGTKLEDVAVRKSLVEGGEEAVARSTDAMIVLARTLDGAARAIRQRYEDEVESVERSSSAKLTAARFAVYGPTQFPDATFTLRLAFGKVKGYEQEGVQIPYYTDFAGLYKLAEAKVNVPPYSLPERWRKATGVRMETPFNFVATLDTTGGNSGSPILNRKAELVGVNFDSNRHKIANDLAYNAERGRNISVSAAGILEALRSVYHATDLLKELDPK